MVAEILTEWQGVPELGAAGSHDPHYIPRLQRRPGDSCRLRYPPSGTRRSATPQQAAPRPHPNDGEPHPQLHGHGGL